MSSGKISWPGQLFLFFSFFFLKRDGVGVGGGGGGGGRFESEPLRNIYAAHSLLNNAGIEFENGTL